jgi:small subunit ribosomal protein S9
MKNIHAVGRRKTSIARVYVKPGNGNITVNGKDYKEFFPTVMLQKTLEEAFELTLTNGKFDVYINCNGGGVRGQAEASRHGIARALILIEESHKEVLKRNGFLKRDPRMVERKKPGQPKARKKFQFRKR